MNYSRLELAAGEDQLVVVFVSEDSGGMIDVGSLATALADDATAREKDGLKLQSLASVPMRQTGTAGNVLFQSGGQYITQAALIAVYSRKTE